ncbi:MAG: hypothetical protein J7496_06530 [Novosphingobium sp.]|nr:hypothetical protein [Novosphingobium sp.]
MELNHYQANVLKLIFERTGIERDMDILRFSLAGDFKGQYVIAVSECDVGDSYIAFNLPSYSSSVFIAITKADVKLAALILANLEDYERETNGVLRLGEAVIMPNPNNDFEIPYAVLLLRTGTLIDIAEIGDVETISDRETSFFFVVPLDRDEHDLRATLGHDALLDTFEAQQKDIFL